MRDLFWEGVLLLGLAMPGAAEYPPADVLEAARSLPQASKERLLEFARGRGCFGPDNGDPDWESFDGVYNILWRRMAGRPLSRQMGDPLGPDVPNK